MDLNYTETHGLFHPLARKPTFTVSLMLEIWEQEDSLTRSRYERGGMSQKHDSIHACE